MIKDKEERSGALKTILPKYESIWKRNVNNALLCVLISQDAQKSDIFVERISVPVFVSVF